MAWAETRVAAQRDQGKTGRVGDCARSGWVVEQLCSSTRRIRLGGGRGEGGEGSFSGFDARSLPLPDSRHPVGVLSYSAGRVRCHRLSIREASGAGSGWPAELIW